MPMTPPRVEADAVTRAAALFRSLGDPKRLAILLELREREQRVADLVNTIGLSQATVSGHLACLRDCGLVDYRPEGRQSFYRLTVPDLDHLLHAAETVLAATGDAVVLCPNYGVSAAADEQAS
ncbi:ArsR/SmtB family transcription factor [Lentzea sp. HUAS TT2]|uniref:ArsR/SmtB family transcription factor n=1 Tax=Lentzea sp. HUAS TT2 TaxID=3447454 RepID=UPI003F7067AD